MLFFVIGGLCFWGLWNAPEVYASPTFEAKKVLDTKFVNGTAHGLAYNGEYYLYKNSDMGYFYKSTNGMDWTRYVPTITDEHNQRAYFSGRKPGKLIWDGRQFVFASGDLVATSEDGVSWSGVHIPYTDFYAEDEKDKTGIYVDYGDSEKVYAIKDIIYTGDLYVLVAQDYPKIVDSEGGFFTYGPNAFFYSKDLKTFENGTKEGITDPYFQERHLNNLAWNGSILLAGGVAFSKDGIHWLGRYSEEYQASNGGFSGFGAIWDGQKFWAASNDTIRSSTDGINWDDVFTLPDDESYTFKGVSFNGKEYIALGDLDTEFTFYHSQDGQQWTKASIEGEESGGIQRVLPTKDGFIVAGSRIYYISNKELNRPSDWAADDIQKAKNHGFVTEELLRVYHEDITRSDFSKLVIELYEELTGKTATAASPNPFTDTTNSFVLKAYQLGIVQGTSSNTFAPESTITRQDMAVMLYKTLKNSGADIGSLSKVWQASYMDVDQIAAYATDALHFLNQKQIMKGNQNSQFLPRGNATREEAIVMLERIYEQFNAGIVKEKKVGFEAVTDFLEKNHYLVLKNEQEVADLGQSETRYLVSTYYEVKNESRQNILTYSVSPRNTDVLPHKIELSFTPETDDYKITLLQNILEKDKQVQVPDLSSILLQRLKTINLPRSENSGVQYIEVNGTKLSYCISRYSENLQYDLEVSYSTKDSPADMHDYKSVPPVGSENNFEYSLELQGEIAPFTFYLVKSKYNDITLSYSKLAPDTETDMYTTPFYHSVTVSYFFGQEDEIQFKLAQAVIEKEKGTTLPDLSETLIQCLLENKDLDGSTGNIPITINGTQLQYNITHYKDRYLYSFVISF